tara:strand:+ start:502 stop:663 length:162 start_codon:yes stop_codon:yes gene_type:complete
MALIINKWYVCQDCGYDREGEYPPDYCPDCGLQHFEVENMEAFSFLNWKVEDE